MDNHDDPQLRGPKRTRRNIEQLLTDPKTHALMKALATRHLSPERLTRLSMIAVQKTPRLLECDPISLLGAFLGCSALGLEPNTPLQHLHLLPFEKGKGEDAVMEVQVIVGYRGYFELGRRSGLITGAHADVVYPNDLFEHQYGTDTFLRHQSRDWEGEPNGYTHAYCFVHLKDGQAFTVMPKSAILRIRDRSQNYKQLAAVVKRDSKQKWKLDKTPWVLDEHRMARKTTVRNLFHGGEVPLSLEMQNAMAIDERRVDFASLTDASAEEIKENLAGYAKPDDDDAQVDESENDLGEPIPEEDLTKREEREREPVEQDKPMATPRGRKDDVSGKPNASDMFR